jgi:hypothetical protein
MGLGSWAGQSGVHIPVGEREKFLFQQRSNRLWCLPIVLYSGYQVYFAGIKRPGREVDHSPLSILEVSNGSSHAPVLMVSIGTTVPLLNRVKW